jgi:hypothetical protein
MNINNQKINSKIVETNVNNNNDLAKLNYNNKIIWNPLKLHNFKDQLIVAQYLLQYLL